MKQFHNNLTNNKSIKNLIKKWFWLYFFTYLSAPLWYIIRVIISNSPDISVSDFWLMYSIIWLVTILYTYNDLWLTESLQFFLPKFRIHKEYDNIKTAIWFSLTIEIITWIIISTCLWFWSNWLAEHYFHNQSASTILRYFCLYFIGMNILQVFQSIFKAFQKTFEFQLTEFIKAISILLFTIFFFFFDDNIEYYSLCRILWLWITIIIASLLYKKYHNSLMRWKFNINEFITKNYIKYSLWAFIWTWIWWIFGQIILQMVLYFLWTEKAWYYSNFLSLYSIGITILWPIRALLYPLTSEYKETANTKAIENLITIFYNYFLVIVLSFSTLLITLWTEISTILFWKDYYLSWILLSYAGIFLLFNLLASFNYQILAWLWKVKEKVYITCIACFLTIIIAILWVKLGNILWATIAFCLSNVFTRILSFYLLKKDNYKFCFKRKFIIKNIILFLVLWFIIFASKSYIISTTWNRLIILLHLILFGVIYYAIIWIINRSEIKTLWNIYKN